MKKTAIIISIILCFNIFHYACKTKTGNNTPCVMVIQNSPNTPSVLSESEMNEIKTLFNNNGMDFTKFQFYQLDTDELGFRHVRCYQLVNNLRVFSVDFIFHFNKDGACYLSSGNLVNVSGIDAKPTLTPNRVAEIFVRKITLEKASMIDQKILSGCIDVELGYVATDGSNEKFTKAWKAKPTDKDYPYAYINDENAEIMYYDNGVRF